jgi:hypothetical protein
MDGSLGGFERIHHQSSCRPKTTSDILTAISDDRSLILFNAIGLMPAGTGILIRKSGLTRRQYSPGPPPRTLSDCLTMEIGNVIPTFSVSDIRNIFVN